MGRPSGAARRATAKRRAESNRPGLIEQLMAWRREDPVGEAMTTPDCPRGCGQLRWANEWFRCDICRNEWLRHDPQLQPDDEAKG